MNNTVDSTNVSDIIKQLEHALTSRYPDSVLRKQTAWWMLEAVTKIDKAHLIAKETITLTEQQHNVLAHWLDQQINFHMPLQYILGSVPFDDVEILVEPPILIPRPETEEWCMHMIHILKKLHTQDISILDICTGSGCIAIALGHAFPETTIDAVDISPQAIALCKKNSTHNDVHNVHCIQSDLFTSLNPEKKYDLIVTNPPYIPMEQWEQLDHSVTKWEDPQALIAPDNGLMIIRNIINTAPDYLTDNPQLKDNNIPNLVIEVDAQHATDVKDLMEQRGFERVVIKKDLSGKERIVMGSMFNVATTEDNQ